MSDWVSAQGALAELAGRTLFFIGGPPRSGTTWVQRLAGAHPQISCRGEALLQTRIEAPIDQLYADQQAALADKRARLFGEDGGYPVPLEDEADLLLGAAVLLALRRQGAGEGVLAVGEKTPENVFLFPRLRRLFPRALFVGVARDPRDVAASAWGFFGDANAGAESREAFIAGALPQIAAGLRAMVALERAYGAACHIVTYEALTADPVGEAAALFRFLGVDDAPTVVEACVQATRFEALTGGRPAGQRRDGAFLRSGEVGTWTEVFTPELRNLALREAGWAFERFGWTGG